MSLRTIAIACSALAISLALVLLIGACATSPKLRISMIDAAPINTFAPYGDVSLASYPTERERMKRAAELYLKERYDIVDQRTYLASAFSRVLGSSLYDILDVKLGAKVVDHKIPEGLASITIWKRGKEYFAVAQSEIIYPGGNGIYGYYELRRKAH